MVTDLERGAGGAREDARASRDNSAKRGARGQRQARTGKASSAATGPAKNRRACDTEPRASLYDEVTARIITQLEAGCFPWVQPWSAAAAVPGLPRNAITGRTYSGVNILILWGAVIEGAYA